MPVKDILLNPIHPYRNGIPRKQMKKKWSVWWLANIQRQKHEIKKLSVHISYKFSIRHGVNYVLDYFNWIVMPRSIWDRSVTKTPDIIKMFQNFDHTINGIMVIYRAVVHDMQTLVCLWCTRGPFSLAQILCQNQKYITGWMSETFVKEWVMNENICPVTPSICIEP